MKSWLQKHHIIHTWGRWELIKVIHTPIVNNLPYTSMSYKSDVQKRACSVCGLVDYN